MIGVLGILKNIFTIAGGVGTLLTLCDKFNRVDLSIHDVANTAKILDHMIAFNEPTDENESDVMCEFLNRSSSIRHVGICGYLFHFGSVFSCGRKNTELMPDFDISRLYTFGNIDYNFEPTSVTTVSLRVRGHLLVTDNNKYAKRCVRIGNLLKHSIIFIRYTKFFSFKKSIYYDVTAKCKLSFFRRVKLLFGGMCKDISNMLKPDYDFIPDNACTDDTVIHAGFDNIDLDNKRILSNCGDFDFGPFYNYLCHRPSISFMCISSKTYEKSTIQFIEDDHSICGLIGGVKPFYCLDNDYYSRYGNQPFNIVDFRHPLMADLLDEHTYVMTCPPKSLFSQYVRSLLSHNINFKILGTYDDIVGFDSDLFIDGDLFDAMFYLPFAFLGTDMYKAHRVYRGKNGEPMIKVRNCCWLVPNYESK